MKVVHIIFFVTIICPRAEGKRQLTECQRVVGTNRKYKDFIIRSDSWLPEWACDYVPLVIYCREHLYRLDVFSSSQLRLTTSQSMKSSEPREDRKYHKAIIRVRVSMPSGVPGIYRLSQYLTNLLVRFTLIYNYLQHHLVLLYSC